MNTITVSAFFRSKINDGIYLFDLITIDPYFKSSSLVGYSIINVPKGKIVTKFTSQLDLKKDIIDELEEIIKEQAMDISKTIFS